MACTLGLSHFAQLQIDAKYLGNPEGKGGKKDTHDSVTSTRSSHQKKVLINHKVKMADIVSDHHLQMDRFVSDGSEIGYLRWVKWRARLQIEKWWYEGER